MGDERVATDHAAVFPNDPAADGVGLAAPLNEPIAQHGPFLMNTAAQIHQALADFRSGQLTAG